MSISDPQDLLELEVENLGPIVEAKVDLRPFTLFVGPSNTGKSYLAILIYALHRFFSGSPGISPLRDRGPRGYRSYRSRIRRGVQIKHPIPENDIPDFIDWGRRLSQEAEVESDTLPKVLPENIAAWIRPLLASSVGASVGAVESEITRCFGVQSLSQLIRNPGTTGARVALHKYIGAAGNPHPFVHTLAIPRRGEPVFSASIPSCEPLQLTRETRRMVWSMGRIEHSDDPEEKKYFARDLANELAEAVAPFLVGSANSPAYYLPADRTGVMHAHRVVVGALIERATSAGIHPTAPMPMLSGVLADFLEQLIALDNPPRFSRPRQGADLANRLEKAILGGVVRYKDGLQQGYPSIVYRPDGWKEDQALPMMRVSSMVSELAPVVLYLRHVVQPGDVLVIEEPESHLHPSMQVELTRLLAAAVREGVRIIMTTHSEWVLEELANLVQLSTLPEAQRGGIDDHGVSLSAREVGAWLFQSSRRPKGSVVQEIRLDPESGTFAAGYDDVAAALHNRWAGISSRSEENKSG